MKYDLDYIKIDYPPMTAEEEQNAIKSLSNDKVKLRNTLILHNVGLVQKVVSKVCLNKSKFTDYMSYGIEGLVKASNSYDKKYTIKFSTYATKCIINEIIKKTALSTMEKNTYHIDSPIKGSANSDEDDGEYNVERKIYNLIDKDSIILKSTDEIVEENSDKIIYKKIYNYLKKTRSNRLRTRDKNIYFDHVMHNISCRDLASKYHMSHQNIYKIINHVNVVFKDLIYRKYKKNSLQSLVNC
jgi:RNA polymerase sporulation-specific sigma factor